LLNVFSFDAYLLDCWFFFSTILQSGVLILQAAILLRSPAAWNDIVSLWPSRPLATRPGEGVQRFVRPTSSLWVDVKFLWAY